MGKDVFANGMEVAHKAGAGKVIAALPDVCLSPPPPPAGPVPVPYPNTSFAKDLKAGSTTVKIGGKPLALKDRSHYKSSPLGDEAATRNFGGSVVTHTITGATYFQASSMDVTVEGRSVCRHGDITTSNHASYPGSTPPFPNAEAQALAVAAVENNKCPCCNKRKHGKGRAMHRDEYYEDIIKRHHRNKSNGIQKGVDAAKKRLAAAKLSGDPGAIAAGRANLAAQRARIAAQGASCDRDLADYRRLSKQAVAPKTCGCPSVAPSPPCDVFYRRPRAGSKRRDAQQKGIEKKWDCFKSLQLKKPADRRIPPLRKMQPGDQVNHLTPKQAGGCPTGEGNLTLDKELCAACRGLEDGFKEFQKRGVRV